LLTFSSVRHYQWYGTDLSSPDEIWRPCSLSSSRDSWLWIMF